MSGNELSIDVYPGDVDIMIGEFQCFAAGPSTNVDDWDGPGTESIYDLAYYDPGYRRADEDPGGRFGLREYLPDAA